MPVLIVANETIGVVCQFIQRTDPTFPLLYFTIDSAIFAGYVAILTLVRSESAYLPSLRIASAGGVLLSSLIFATVIAPASQTGTWIQPHDDYWVRTATILLHGIAPILITIEFVLAREDRIPYMRALPRGYFWPLTYLIVLVLLISTGTATMPYPFLNPERLGWWAVLAVVCTLLALISGITFILLAIRNTVQKLV
ncbi:hypothetical protein P5V90_06795 [Mycobacteroides abscessus subsp. abscessus]|uniref:hypothetical protein n=1 Tax=Mycobacteroides abscessus TaxID=36809 RepID=UPI00266D14D9|nr:hypothetical protein [Mycobacteroides abscessus]MDO3166663.1 hypothetical protein [Mycobacteroides abscessus subsp. abscessus]